MAKSKTSQSIVTLTAAQETALATAACRNDGTVTLPARLKGKTAEHFVNALTGKGLVREIRAKEAMPVCRRDAATGRAYALIITKLGRSSVPNAPSETAAAECGTKPESAKLPPAAPAATIAEWRVLTPAEALGERGESESRVSARAEEPPAGITNLTKGNAPRQGSKLSQVIALLFRENGASIEELMASTGWLPHTTRAALTGLRKRGYEIVRERRDENGSVYRIEFMSCAEAA